MCAVWFVVKFATRLAVFGIKRNLPFLRTEFGCLCRGMIGWLTKTPKHLVGGLKRME